MPQKAPQRNRMLDCIVRDCRAIASHVEAVSFEVGHEINASGSRFAHVYFPTTGVISTLLELRDGSSVETLTVGREGVIGVPVFLGLEHSLERIVQQGAGELLRIAARTFCREIAGHRRTETLLKRFTLYRLRVAAQNAVCGVRHDIRQRACRWLLATADRAGSNEIPLPQSLLAEMLGVRRQSVGLVAVELQRQGIISTRRARVRILDRPRLRGLACECYDELNALYGKIVGPVL